MDRTILLSAGGTGGHLFPAQALAGELNRRGWRVELVTDHRATHYGGDFPAAKIHTVPSGTPSSRNPLAVASALVKLALGLLQSIRIVRRTKPQAVVGFGGYPTVPPLMAGWLTGAPLVLHEQNAVMGRANGMLSRLCDKVALSFEGTRAPQRALAKSVLCGNPVREAVHHAATWPFEEIAPNGPIKLLVFGGSQGARFFSDMMPGVFALLPADLQKRLEIVQQCREEDMARVGEAYAPLKLNVELAPFFPDLPHRIARSHLIISRSGASTIGELTVIGRPAILVPLPGAIDQDQRANGAVLERAGGALMMEQSAITPERFAEAISGLISDPEALKAKAEKARSAGRPDAVERLADLVESIAGGEGGGAVNAASGEPV